MPSSEVFNKFKTGKLHSGSKKGPVVGSHKQATAIFLSEKRKEEANEGEYPEPKKKKRRGSRMPLREAYTKNMGY